MGLFCNGNPNVKALERRGDTAALTLPRDSSTGCRHRAAALSIAE
jgi:hypothetical protein